MTLMRKADLLDEIRAEIGVVSDGLNGDITELFEFTVQSLYRKVPAYQCVGVYLVSNGKFRCMCQAGQRYLSPIIPFGEGLHSLAAARGGVVREQSENRTEVYVPFYRGHHLIGELVMIGEPGESIDEEDISLFCEIASLFESKVEECSP
ncbi:hypothetical protein GXN76_10255 [Kroppenstedtia pulmonis]|uniref:GAF domain-containing protein n=1 Tax=Kroppenstedtia pulmonis TaxID=1380685 RepID=A0A7D4CNH2_9BACL|nr:hypothetical protein [Kroppenstedtia pulmonis]QKG84818.1 hypothetical protein GXN76_10255 [Kroppenstedtia pulmonis]